MHQFQKFKWNKIKCTAWNNVGCNMGFELDTLKWPDNDDDIIYSMDCGVFYYWQTLEFTLRTLIFIFEVSQILICCQDHSKDNIVGSCIYKWRNRIY